jgi:hypothetical protein
MESGVYWIWGGHQPDGPKRTWHWKHMRPLWRIQLQASRVTLEVNSKGWHWKETAKTMYIYTLLHWSFEKRQTMHKESLSM